MKTLAKLAFQSLKRTPAKTLFYPGALSFKAISLPNQFLPKHYFSSTNESSQETPTNFQIADQLAMEGRYEESLKYMFKALEDDLKVYGEDHERIAALYNNIGSLNDFLDRHEEAIESLNKAISIKEKLQHQDEELALFYSNIGRIYMKSRQFDKAIEAHARSIELQLKEQQIEGASEDMLIDNFLELGLAFHNQKLYQKAIDNYNQALNLIKKTQGENSQDAIFCYDKISQAYHDAGQYEKAMPIYQKLVEINRKNDGDLTVNGGLAKGNMGHLMLAERRYEEALKYFNEALEVFKKVNPNDENVGFVYMNLGDTYTRMENNAKTIENFKLALEVFTKTRGPNDQTVESIKKLVADLNGNQ